jgi:L-ribulose-5-phosphate 4-epimerase
VNIEEVNTEEGSIKYRCIHNNKALNYMPIMDEINLYRTKLRELGLIGIYPSQISFGNISYRLNNESFIISGTMTGAIEYLKPEHFAIVDKADINNNTVYCRGQIYASSESLTHSAIYKIESSMNSVIHIHSVELWSKLLQKVPTTPSTAKYGTPEIANSIKEIFRANNDILNKGIIALGGHQDGLITFSSDINSAFNSIITHFKK